MAANDFHATVLQSTEGQGYPDNGPLRSPLHAYNPPSSVRGAHQDASRSQGFNTGRIASADSRSSAPGPHAPSLLNAVDSRVAGSGYAMPSANANGASLRSPTAPPPPAAAASTQLSNLHSPADFRPPAPFQHHHSPSSPSTSLPSHYNPHSIAASSTSAHSTRPPIQFNTGASQHYATKPGSPSSAPSSLSSGLPPLAPPQGASGPIMTSHGANGANGPHHTSPLQPPRTSGRLSSASDYTQPAREKTSGRVYDPLTDTTSERRPSDSWSSNKPV